MAETSWPTPYIWKVHTAYVISGSGRSRNYLWDFTQIGKPFILMCNSSTHVLLCQTSADLCEFRQGSFHFNRVFPIKQAVNLIENILHRQVTMFNKPSDIMKFTAPLKKIQ